MSLKTWFLNFFGFEVKQKPVEPVDLRCGALHHGGSEINSYRHYCRLVHPHSGRKHKAGGYEWGEGTSRPAPVTAEEDDIGQGEGCEGGKCELRK